MALVLKINRDSKPTHENISDTLKILESHPQSGISIPIPRKLWKKKYRDQKLQPVFVDREDFWVGHVLIPAEDRSMLDDMLQAIQEELRFRQLKVLSCEVVEYRFDRLPQFPIDQLPIMVQLSGYDESNRGGNFENRLYDIKTRLEKMLAIEFISLSTHNIVYKLPVTPQELIACFADLSDPDCESNRALGFSGTLDPDFRNWQPFANATFEGTPQNMDRFEFEAGLLNIKFPENASAAHKLSRMLEGLIQTFPVSLPEAQEMLWPIPNQKHASLHNYYEKTLPLPVNSAVSLIAQDHECAIAINCELSETANAWIIKNSTKPTHTKLAISNQIKKHDELLQWVFNRSSQHRDLAQLEKSFVNLEQIDFKEVDQKLKQPIQLSKPYGEPKEILKLSELNQFHPTLIGKRPLIQPDDHPEKSLTLPFPVLHESKRQPGILALQDLVGWFVTQNPSSISFLHSTYSNAQDPKQVLKDLGEDAVKTVLNGCRVIILDDTTRFNPGMSTLELRDAINSVQKALMAYVGKIEQNLRRSCSIVVRTGDAKSVSDIQKILGWGADAVVPYQLKLV